MKKKVWIATDSGACLQQRGLHCSFYYPLYTAVLCTVWNQTAAAVLILINKVLVSLHFYVLTVQKDCHTCIGVLDNLGSVWEVSSSLRQSLGNEHCHLKQAGCDGKYVLGKKTISV